LQKKQDLAVLQTNGSGVLSFAGVGASAGQVIQVVSTTSNSSESINSQTFTELTTLTTSITPSSASSKILILGRVAHASTTGSANSFVHFRLRRDSTDICQGDGASGSMVNVTASSFASDNDVMDKQTPFTFLDSPNTTSAISYKIMGANWTGASGFTINRPPSPDGLFYNGFVTSTLTLMEIKG
jgi:hypothetical protein